MCGEPTYGGQCIGCIIKASSHPLFFPDQGTTAASLVCISAHWHGVGVRANLQGGYHSQRGEPAGTRTQGPRLKRAAEQCNISPYFTIDSASFLAVERFAKNYQKFPENITIQAFDGASVHTYLYQLLNRHASLVLIDLVFLEERHHGAPSLTELTRRAVFQDSVLATERVMHHLNHINLAIEGLQPLLAIARD